MARRRVSGFESFLKLASILPWWVNLILALIAFIAFNAMASIEPSKVTNANEMSMAVAGPVYRSIGQLLQYVVPLLFCFSAVASVVSRRKRAALLAQTKERGSKSALLELSWHDFERLVGEAFKQRGYQVIETGGDGPDGGVDLLLKRGNETFLVQCKQWRATKVGVDVVRQLFGVMAAKGATGGFVVSSGDFTADAIAFADGRNIELVDADKLLCMVGVQSAQDAGPKCPKCGSDMVERVAGHGALAGQSFWGCSKYPVCKGTQNIGENKEHR